MGRLNRRFHECFPPNMPNIFLKRPGVLPLIHSVLVDLAQNVRLDTLASGVRPGKFNANYLLRNCSFDQRSGFWKSQRRGPDSFGNFESEWAKSWRLGNVFPRLGQLSFEVLISNSRRSQL